MPWCPKCKTEYREGFRVCADCGSELVAEQPLEERRTSQDAEMTGVDIPGVESGRSFGGEAVREDVDADGTGDFGPDSPELEDAKPHRAGGGYRDSSERASENRSSAWILLIVGILGLIAVVLGAADVLPIHMGNSYLFYGVMGAIFILFVVSGVVSMKNAKFFDRKAESENTLRSTLVDWCRQNLDAGEIDSRVGSQEVSEEILYFRRFAYIKEKMNHQFVNLDQEFLDRFIDDYVYESVFEGKAE